MGDLIKSISSYNIFNNLLPGVVFSIIATKIYSIPILQNNIVTGVFLYYFIGMIISRIGSLIIEPLLKKIGFLKFSNYKDYILASKNDDKIIQLSETNNVYRTSLATILCTALLGGFIYLKGQHPEVESLKLHIMTIFLIVLFGWSYKKQTSYISSRVDRFNQEGI